MNEFDFKSDIMESVIFNINMYAADARAALFDDCAFTQTEDNQQSIFNDIQPESLEPIAEDRQLYCLNVFNHPAFHLIYRKYVTNGGIPDSKEDFIASMKENFSGIHNFHIACEKVSMEED